MKKSVYVAIPVVMVIAGLLTLAVMGIAADQPTTKPACSCPGWKTDPTACREHCHNLMGYGMCHGPQCAGLYAEHFSDRLMGDPKPGECAPGYTCKGWEKDPAACRAHCYNAKGEKLCQHEQCTTKLSAEEITQMTPVTLEGQCAPGYTCPGYKVDPEACRAHCYNTSGSLTCNLDACRHPD